MANNTMLDRIKRHSVHQRHVSHCYLASIETATQKIQNGVLPQPQQIQSSMYFLKPNDSYKQEKPYSFQCSAQNGLPQSNFALEKHAGITFRDIRTTLQSLDFEKNGFSVLRLPEAMSNGGLQCPEGLSLYFKQVETLLKDHLGACTVKVFRHIVSYGSLQRTSFDRDRD
jgi:hypothetical protein